MAVNFNHHIEDLIRDFQRRGLKPEIVQTTGNPPRAMEIRIAKKISVHWDADSRSVWAEGPWPEIERLESYIRRRFHGRWRRRGRVLKTIMRVLVLSVIATLLVGICIPSVRNHLSSLSWPFAPEVPRSTPVENADLEDGSSANKKSELKPFETAAAP